MSELFGHGGGHHGGGHHGGHGFRGGWGWGWPAVVNYDCDPLDDPDCRRVEIIGEDDTKEFVKAEHDRQQQMNLLKQVPVGIARVLLKNGQWAIDHAKLVASSKSLPGDTARQKVATAIAGHAAALSKLTDPAAIYAGGSDLKNQVTYAFREADVAENAPSAGSLARSASASMDAIGATWDAMWIEIKNVIAHLPENIRKLAGGGIEWLTGVPVWGWAVGGVALVGILGWAIYKLANTQAGATVASAYLGGRR